MKKYLFEVPPVFPLEVHSYHLYLSYPFKKNNKDHDIVCAIAF